MAAQRAEAQSAEAAKLFDDGDRLMAHGDLAAACDAFDASNQVESRAGTLIRLGECRQRNHQIASAWSAYKDALTRVKDPKKREIAAAKVAELEPLLSYLIVNVPDESRVDGLVLTRNSAPLEAVLWNRAVPVDGGTYTIGGRAPGHEQWSATIEVPGERGKVSVDVPRFPELAKLVVAPKLSRQPTTAHADESAPPRRHRTTLAIALASTCVAAIATGIVFGLQSRSRRDDASGLCPDPTATCDHASDANALESAGKTRALAADIAFAVGGAAAIAAGVVWLTGRPEGRSVAVAPTPTGVMAFGRW
ncbi:MAG TPA: hypothetical protein VGO00_01860 [Kofleriaceae bacterium]|nr:hypothetical protein [Kofleriaceae bacterium]